MTRIKHTFGPPHVCLGCYWEHRYKATMEMNKRLRLENMKLTGAKRSGRPAAPERHDDSEEREDGVRDVLDEMNTGPALPRLRSDA